MPNISIWKLELVKEKGSRYEVKNIISSKVAYEMFRDIMGMEKQSEEVFNVVGLDTKNNVVGMMEVSRGSVNSSLCHPREIFKRAFMMNCSAIIISHNHPSGNPEPSKEDKEVTARLTECGRLLGIDVLDHIIIGDSCYYSFKEEKKI